MDNEPFECYMCKDFKFAAYSKRSAIFASIPAFGFDFQEAVAMSGDSKPQTSRVPRARNQHSKASSAWPADCPEGATVRGRRPCASDDMASEGHKASSWNTMIIT